MLIGKAYHIARADPTLSRCPVFRYGFDLRKPSPLAPDSVRIPLLENGRQVTTVFPVFNRKPIKTSRGGRRSGLKSGSDLAIKNPRTLASNTALEFIVETVSATPHRRMEWDQDSVGQSGASIS